MAELGPVHSVSRSPEYQDMWHSKNVSRHLYATTYADAGGGDRQEGHTTAARGLLWLTNGWCLSYWGVPKPPSGGSAGAELSVCSKAKPRLKQTTNERNFFLKIFFHSPMLFSRLYRNQNEAVLISNRVEWQVHQNSNKDERHARRKDQKVTFLTVVLNTLFFLFQHKNSLQCVLDAVKNWTSIFV